MFLRAQLGVAAGCSWWSGPVALPVCAACAAGVLGWCLAGMVWACGLAKRCCRLQLVVWAGGLAKILAACAAGVLGECFASAVWAGGLDDCLVFFFFYLPLSRQWIARGQGYGSLVACSSTGVFASELDLLAHA